MCGLKNRFTPPLWVVGHEELLSLDPHPVSGSRCEKVVEGYKVLSRTPGRSRLSPDVLTRSVGFGRTDWTSDGPRPKLGTDKD